MKPSSARASTRERSPPAAAAPGASQERHVDVLILGAGLSGIGAACHLARRLKHKSYAILERREAIGGTWDLFRYPGIRSDSDMSTFGFNFRPWREPRVLSDGASIKRYLTEAAEQNGVTQHIRFGRRVTRAEWSSAKAQWTVTVYNTAIGAEETHTANFLIAATGYYSYDFGYTPAFPGREAFKGTVVHPQHWPEGLDYAGKKVTVIGSGATAITLVPSLAAGGAKVTMLQRSPTYVLSVPAIDPLWEKLSRVLPVKLLYAATRARNIGLQRALYVASRRKPQVVKRLIRGLTSRQLGDSVDIRHFTPSYNPWEERLCIVPDGDLFRALRNGSARIVTDTIKTFDETGIRLDSGEHLDADIIVTATGLNVQMFGGVKIVIDGKPFVVKEHMFYKGMMLNDVPNLLAISGYTNASWTLKADIVCEHFMRLIAHMDRKKLKVVTPRAKGVRRLDDTVFGSLASGYLRRGADNLPRQGDRAPWIALHDYLRDATALKFGSVSHPELEFRAQ
ncbi:NAD(P)/FAD-dependent oxidoreductase [Solimonas sp. K1W22B-7]|uniref:flavin-containing monooxygenase n=1 Tax=Solimonas sp. K1W22B-7 TaxID=2303331 RepID=UPI000E33604B|nr:NAD(P)/FAD-dependent oxidoreductase [Solimonas sp. K1W22B-7]AXQ31119.1 NAD(P)/FAD-dependent oxidoreductase [Solimonas sp. K1W22B-7]